MVQRETGLWAALRACSEHRLCRRISLEGQSKRYRDTFTMHNDYWMARCWLSNLCLYHTVWKKIESTATPLYQRHQESNLIRAKYLTLDHSGWILITDNLNRGRQWRFSSTAAVPPNA